MIGGYFVDGWLLVPGLVAAVALVVFAWWVNR